jgi:hypothetical protein
MDYGQLFRRGWEIVWQNKFLFVLGFLAALGAGGSGGGGSSNFNVPSGSSSSEPFPPEILDQFTNFWAEFGGLTLGLLCFFFILSIVFWLIRLAAQGGLIEAVDRIEAGEKISFGTAFSAGTARIGRLVGLNLLINAPFIFFGLLIGGVGASIFASIISGGGTLSDTAGGLIGILAICAGLLVCILVPLGFIVTLVQPFAQRGLMIKQLGVVDSIRHGWQVLRDNLGDIILLGVAFLVIGFLFGLVTLVFMIPFAFLAMGPLFLEAIQGGDFNFGVTQIVTLSVGVVCLGVAAAAINSVLTAYRSATVTLAYQQFVQKEV